MAGTGGARVTTTVVVAVGEGQPPTVAVTLYVPSFSALALEMTGVRVEAVNPFGPVQV